MAIRLSTAIERRRRVRRVVRHAEMSLATAHDAKLPLSELADVACMSPYHFTRLYLHAVGETPQATIRRLRLRAARRRLAENSTLSVIEAALDHGYESAQAFARAFRRQFGVPPGARAPDEGAAVAISIAHLPAVRAQTLPVTRSWDGVADAFDELLGRLDAADVPRRGQDMCGLLSPEGEFGQACAIENDLVPTDLPLDRRELGGGWGLRIAGQTHAVWRRFRSDERLRALRQPDAPLIMRYGNDPAYVARDEQRVALYLPLPSNAPLAEMARAF